MSLIKRIVKTKRQPNVIVSNTVGMIKAFRFRHLNVISRIGSHTDMMYDRTRTVHKQVTEDATSTCTEAASNEEVSSK